MNYVYIGLLVLALVVIELLIGGTRLIFALPSCGILALVSFLSLYSFRRSQVPSNVYCLASAGLLVGYLILRIFFSPVEYLARTDLYALLGAVLTYLFVALILTVPKYRFIFVMTLLVIAVGHVTIGGIQYLRGEPFPLFDFLQRTDPGLRAAGLYICPNHLAGYLEVSAMMGLSVVCWSRQSFWLKLLAGYGALISAVGIVLTGSRGGYLSTFVGLTAFVLLSWAAIRRANRHQIWVSAFGAVLVAIVMFAGITALFSRHYALQSRAAKVFDTRDIRFDLWKMALKQYQLNPVFGTGAGTYQYHARRFRPPEIQADPVHAHNDYVQLLAEYGSIGLLTGLGFLACHLWFGWKAMNYFVTVRPIARYRMRSDALALNIGALSCVVTYMVHSMLDFNLHIPANAMLLGFVFAILANPGIMMPNINEAREKISHYLKLALPAIGLWITAAGLPTLPAEYFAERARVSLTEGGYKEAVSYAELGLVGDRKNPYLPLYLGQAHWSLAEGMTSAGSPDTGAAQASYEAAAKAFEAGLELYPQEQWLLEGLASSLDGLGRHQEARETYLKALEVNPASAPLHVYYATHLRLTGDYDEAERMYKKSMELHPNHGALAGLEMLAQARKKDSEGRK